MKTHDLPGLLQSMSLFFLLSFLYIFFIWIFIVYLSRMLFNQISNLMSWISDNLHLLACSAVFKPFAVGVLLLLMLWLHTL